MSQTSMKVLSIRLFLCLGYLPLVSFVVPVIIDNVYTYKFSGHGIESNIFVIYIIITQYLMTAIYLVFHIFFCVYRRAWTVTLVSKESCVNFFSSAFSFFAGGSLYIIGLQTAGYHNIHTGKNRAYFAGYICLVFIQFFGYFAWSFLVQKEFPIRRIRWHTTRHFRCNASHLKYILFLLFAALAFISFLLYSASVVSNMITLQFSYKKRFLIETKSVHYFNVVSLHMPILLFPVLLTSQVLCAFLKKTWVAPIVFLSKNLIYLFLGYIVYLLLFYIGQNLNQHNNQIIWDSLVLLISTSLLLSLFTGCMCVFWSMILWARITSERETSFVEIPFVYEESQPLLPSIGDH